MNSSYPDVSVFSGAKFIKAQAKPSEYSLVDPAPLFRKEFFLDEIGNARLFVQSPGFARYYINGVDVTRDLFISAVSDYTKILWYNEYDVTHLLHKGKNSIAVILGNGFFNESFESAWHFPNALWRDAPQFLLSLYVDGTAMLVSDSSWKCSIDASFIIYNHLRSGEYWDMRNKDDAWLYVGFDDSAWSSAIERDGAITAELRPIACQPVREVDRVTPLSISRTERGYLVDFGVTMSGYIEIKLKEERGREISFWYTEDIYPDGSPKYNDMNTPYYYPASPFHLNKLIASGNEDNFKPIFSYHGFRYVLIEGMTGLLSSGDVCAYFIHQDVERRSSFNSGNPVLNFIYNAGIRSTYSNMFWSLTDCPTREKLGWTNDAQNSVEQTLINFDILPLYEKWYEDVKSCMLDSGALPGIIPTPSWGYDWGPVCDFMLYEIPYRVYLYTGRSNMLVDAIPYFERYLNYLIKRVEEGHEFILGDWLGYKSSEEVPKEYIRDLYLIKSLAVTDFANRIAGTGVVKWGELLLERRSVFLDEYFDTDGRCTVNSQCALSMAITLGVFKDKDVIHRQLVDVVIKDGYTLTCGMVGIQYIYDALAECGRADIACKMLTESDPGYKSWYDRGATTLWERWDGADWGSHNHHMYSGIISWFYKRLLGIQPSENGVAFSSLTLKPCFVREVGFVCGEIQTVKGNITASWQAAEDGFVYTVTIPEGVRATFGGETLAVGTNRFSIKE